jgi:CubicO group peptidase (beta-lactamase class C family)
MADIPIEGHCDARFERVRKAFVENFRTGFEVGAAVAVTLEGRAVVDLWGGYMEKERLRPWTRDTLVNVFSTTKGLTAVCANRLVEQGRLDLDAAVASYWPEFAQAGKEKMPVRYLLSHRAGLPAIKKPLPVQALYQWDTMCAALAEQEPWWEPGTKHGYHAMTFGWLVGEVVRRITGMSLGTYFRKEVAEPLGLDCHIGLDARHDLRTATMIPAPPLSAEQTTIMQRMLGDNPLIAKALNNPPVFGTEMRVNGREWRAAELPAANAHSTARSIARLYGALACGGEIDGVRVLSPASIERACAEQSYGPDAVLTIATRFGLGFMISQPGMGLLSFGSSGRGFGHPGAGGSIGFADPAVGIGFGYTMNQMGQGIISFERVSELINAAFASI